MNNLIFSYIGPDTILPLASALAACGGAIMIFWRYIVRFCKNVWRLTVRRGEDV